MNTQGNIGRYSSGKIKRKDRIRNELEEYLKEDCLSDDSTNEMVKMYWETKKFVYPTLYKLSRKYLTLLASSCSSERLFSDASNYFIPFSANFSTYLLNLYSDFLRKLLVFLSLFFSGFVLYNIRYNYFVM